MKTSLILAVCMLLMGLISKGQPANRTTMPNIILDAKDAPATSFKNPPTYLN